MKNFIKTIMPLALIMILMVFFSMPVNGSNSSNGKQYVDLGLPSGTLWATMNVGASRPEDYGSYFAWGETSPKQVYSWGTYKWCNGDFDKLTKYCTKSRFGNVDNKTELDLSDDAAYVNWGSGWRMPSQAQLSELQTECTWQLTSRNGVKGYLVSSKRNSNSLFLPAAGRRTSSLEYTGYYGGYYSRTVRTDHPDEAIILHFSSVELFWLNCRYIGLSVRAVRR